MSTENVFPKKLEPRGTYILNVLNNYFLNGDAYTTVEDAITLCMQEIPGISYNQVRYDLHSLLSSGELVLEGRRLYLARTKAYEDYIAAALVEIMKNNTLDTEPVTAMTSGDVQLNDLQQAAIQMAYSHRISMILGGAGSGKTTLVKALTEACPDEHTLILAAPTGKAARNLRDHGCYGAKTIHSALGKAPNQNFLSAARWKTLRMVVIDEASMLTTEMFAGLLCKMPDACSLVLIGDPGQLGSVGSGNVIPDLLELGFPATRLTQQYRQKNSKNALHYNVTQFPALQDSDALRFDASFQLIPADKKDLQKVVQREAVKRYQTGEDVQVIAGTNQEVKSLNRLIQEAVNPWLPKKQEITNHSVTIRENDRVMILRNDSKKGCANGDVGVIQKVLTWQLEDVFEAVRIQLSEAHTAIYPACEVGWSIVLAYAMTAHKSQGSQYDTVIVMLPMSCPNVLWRNLLYTAISRAKNKVILIGSEEALHLAMTTPPERRKSMLVTKVHQKQLLAA